VRISVVAIAQVSPPPSLPAKSAAFLVTATGRIRNRRLVPTLRHGLLMVRCRG
jgi:hypothetical protein